MPLQTADDNEFQTTVEYARSLYLILITVPI